MSYLSPHSFNFPFIGCLLFTLNLFKLCSERLLHLFLLRFDLPLELSSETVYLCREISLYLLFLSLQPFNLRLVGVQASSLVLAELLELVLVALLLGLLDGLPYLGVLVDEGLLVLVELVLHLPLQLPQLLIALLLDLQLLSLLLLCQLLLVDTDLLVDLLLQLLPDPFLLLPLVHFPPLSLLLHLQLVLLDDLLFLQFEVPVDLLNGTSEVLFEKLPLLFHVFIDFCLD